MLKDFKKTTVEDILMKKLSYETLEKMLDMKPSIEIDKKDARIKKLEKGIWEIMDMTKSPKIRDKIFEIMEKK